MNKINKTNESTWSNHYRQKKERPTLNPEGFIVRLLTSKFPSQVVTDIDYKGKKVLDLSCGYGRNLGFLKNLEFDLYATEITEEIVQSLKENISGVDFQTGKANQLPFKDNFFDGIVACNSCYYLDEDVCFADNLLEIQKKIKPGGWFIGSIIKASHTGLKDAEWLEDGSAIVRQDQLQLRNGYRLHYANSIQHTKEMLSPNFKNITIGEFSDNLMGFRRDFFYFHAEKK